MNKKDLMTDDLLKRGHPHPEKKRLPRVCHNCQGRGEVIVDATRLHARQGFRKMDCPVCGGEGELEQ